MATVLSGERLGEPLFGVTGDFRVVSDRLDLFECDSSVLPGISDRDVQQSDCVVVIGFGECNVDVVVCDGVILAVTLGSVSENRVGVRPAS